jgi:hypothetical protein
VSADVADSADRPPEMRQQIFAPCQRAICDNIVSKSGGGGPSADIAACARGRVREEIAFADIVACVRNGKTK